MPCRSHFSIDSRTRRACSGPVPSLHAYVGIHAPNRSFAIVCPPRVPCSIACRAAEAPGLAAEDFLPFEVADLEHRAVGVDAVRAVEHAGRPAGVHAGGEPLLLADVDELALEDPHFLPELVGDGVSGLDAGLEPEQTRAVAGVGVATQDLLGDPPASGAAAGRALDGLPRQIVGPRELAL